MKNNILLLLVLFFVLTPIPTAFAEYDHNDVKKIIHEAAKEIKPDLTESGLWYAGDAERIGLLSFSDYGPLASDMQNIDYWDMDKRLAFGEFPGQMVSSSIMFSAPTPDGHRVVVQIDGYDLPLSEIRPVAENVFIVLVERSVESGAVGQSQSSTYEQQTDEYSGELAPGLTDTGNTVVDSGELTGQYDDTGPIESSFMEHENNAGKIDELFSIYSLLENEKLVQNKGELPIEDISQKDIESYQSVNMNYVLPDEFVSSIQTQAKIIDMIRKASSEDIDRINGMDLSEVQDIEANRGIIKQAFVHDFTLDEEKPVEISGGVDYDGKDRLADKLDEIMTLEKIDKTTTDLLKKMKTGHEAASFFSDDYSNSKLSQTFKDIDRIKSVKDEVDKYVGAYNDYEKLSEMKGTSGTSVKALYVVAKTGQEVAGKVPVVGEFIKKEMEMVEKIVMVMPELDDAIKNSDLRQGKITSGGIGTSTPNAFLSKYGTKKQTSDGPVYSMPYTDEKGKTHEINPDLWIKVTVKGETYYVPTDEDEKPIGDVAIKDIGNSWKPWKWDNCQVVKRTDPNVTYNNGEEYDL
ncbi:MAG: hypothetical protein PWR29_499 [Methanolobus sp.]|nr:hypothetical protein [Methanolobus sp.]MDN5309814.1 hypothetical protein [Methanolobus sp.]